ALEATNIQLVHPPAVLMVVRGMILAHTVPIALTSVPLTINQDMKALVPGSRLEAEFLGFYLQAINPALLSYVEEAAHGTKRLASDVWRKIPLVLPPREEQHQ